MKISAVLFATSIMGAAAQYGYSGFDLEQRGLDLEQRDFELDQREIDLERREVKFKRMARAWLAARGEIYNPPAPTPPTPPPRPPTPKMPGQRKTMKGRAWLAVRGRKSPIPDPGPSPPPTPPPRPPTPKMFGQRKTMKGRAWLAARDAQDGLIPRSSPCSRPCGEGEYCDAGLKQCIPVPPTRDPPAIPQGNNRAPNKKPAPKKGRK